MSLDVMRWRVWSYEGCGTCKKSIAWMRSRGVAFDLLPIVESPPSRDELEALWKQSSLPIKRFFNTSGQSYRRGEFGRRLPTMSDAEALDALAADGKLIKRPLVEAGGHILVGFQADAWEVATRSWTRGGSGGA